MSTTLSKLGDVKIGTDTIAEMASWTLNIVDELAVADNFDSDWHRVAGSVKQSWTASVNGWYDPSDTQQALVLSKVLSGGDFNDIRLYEDATNYHTPDTGTDANATAYISDVTVTVDRSGVNAISFNLTGSGPILRTTD